MDPDLFCGVFGPPPRPFFPRHQYTYIYMDPTPIHIHPSYTAHSLRTEDGDYSLVIILRGLESSDEATRALHSIMGPFDEPESVELH